MSLLRVSLLMLTLLMASTSHADTTEFDTKINDATTVLQSLQSLPERAIPPALLRRARAIVVLPDFLKFGVVLGGSHGRGVMNVRSENGWSAPVFVTLSGGSIGFQAGVQRSDLVLVFTNDEGVRNITRGKFTLGADASVAAGPIGRRTTAATDYKFDAAVYSYSRAKGIFAGVSITGAALRIDDDANAAFYATVAIQPERIIAGEVTLMPDSARNLRATLPRLLQGMAAAPAPASPGTPASVPTPEPASNGVTTYAIGERPAATTADNDDDE
ncbi:MAG: lipid-binding SYLF domain-containing protein [Pseudomonadota bacterium]